MSHLSAVVAETDRDEEKPPMKTTMPDTTTAKSRMITMGQKIMYSTKTVLENYFRIYKIINRRNSIILIISIKIKEKFFEPLAEKTFAIFKTSL